MLQGHEAGDQFGYCVAGLGDVDKKYYDDLLISAPGSTLDKGLAYLYYGDDMIGPDEDVSILGEGAGSRFGISMASGDINGDGYNDFTVGTVEKERIYVFYGNRSMTPVIDLAVNAPHIENRREANEQFGAGLAVIPSFNNSGIDYIIIGAPGSGGAGDFGRVYIVKTVDGPVLPYGLESRISWMKSAGR